MPMPIAYDIPINLYEMFSGKGRPIRQATLKAIMDAKMLEGTPVKDHIIRMIRPLKRWRSLELRSLIDSFHCVFPLFALPSNENYNISQKMKEPNINQTRLWHLRLNRIQILVKFGILPSLIP